MLPPAWLRRLVLAPAVVLLAVLAFTTLPISAVAAAFISPRLPGRWRTLRVLWFVLVLLATEAAAVLGCAGLWIVSGFGRNLSSPRFQAAHHWVLRTYLAVAVRTAVRVFSLRVDVAGLREALDAAREQGRPDAPLLVLSRHAGPGDSFLLVYGLTLLDRRPHVVLKAILRWAPSLDLLLGRLPSVFVGGGTARAAAVGAIGSMAAGLGSGDAMVIFPEGGNFTEGRRLRSISRLEELGQHQRAERARMMRHVLSPRPGGVIAALDACPQADVIFVAHTGLEDLSHPVDLWRGMPLDAAISVMVWRVPAEEVPTDPTGRGSWLDGWWHRIDHWIVEQRGTSAVPDAVLGQLQAQDAASARATEETARRPADDGPA